MLPSDLINERAHRIKLLLMDCDGVLTDGSLHFTSAGETAKVFHIHDGQGMRLAHDAGLKLGIISGRRSDALAARAKEMGIDYLFQGTADKLAAYNQIKHTENLQDEEIAYLGDDLPDLVLLRRVGLSIAVANAVAEVRAVAHYVTEQRGGCGAVREVIELILKSQGRWEELIARF